MAKARRHGPEAPHEINERPSTLPGIFIKGLIDRFSGRPDPNTPGFYGEPLKPNSPYNKFATIDDEYSVCDAAAQTDPSQAVPLRPLRESGLAARGLIKVVSRLFRLTEYNPNEYIEQITNGSGHVGRSTTARLLSALVGRTLIDK